MNGKCGIYIHIPFCRQKCLYCDFPSSANAEFLFEDYTAALCREIAGKGGILSGLDIDTVYFGGGTPTVLSAKDLGRILETLARHANLVSDAEITVEANPGTLGGGKTAELKSAGFNRLSIGVQAFDDIVLQGAGRIHAATEAIVAVEEAAACFANISIDLIYGLPHQSPASFSDGLRRAVLLPVRHISVYGLKVEENTPFCSLQSAGKLDLPDEAEEDAMYEFTTGFLPENGFRRYEISNYAQSNFESRHNLKYWRYEPYLGFGSAAHSFWQNERTANTPDIAEYIAWIKAGASAITFREKSGRDTAMGEYLFLALRTTQGLAVDKFDSYFAADFWAMYSEIVDKLIKQGLIGKTPDGICLTARGMKYGNFVFASFLPD